MAGTVPWAFVLLRAGGRRGRRGQAWAWRGMEGRHAGQAGLMVIGEDCQAQPRPRLRRLHAAPATMQCMAAGIIAAPPHRRNSLALSLVCARRRSSSSGPGWPRRWACSQRKARTAGGEGWISTRASTSQHQQARVHRAGKRGSRPARPCRLGACRDTPLEWAPQTLSD